MTRLTQPSSPGGGLGTDRAALRRFAARWGFPRSDWAEMRDRMDLAADAGGLANNLSVRYPSP
jgi:hypothetical protein